MYNSTGIVPTSSALGKLMRAARAIGVGSLAGALSGLAWGALARLAMRLIAREMGQLPSFSLGGTLIILVLGIIVGSIIGAVYAGLRPLLPRRRVWKGVALGLVVLGTLGIQLYNGPLVEEGSPEVRALAVALFGGSLLIWGGLIEALYQPLDRRLLPGGQGRLAALASGVALALPLLFAAALVAAQLLGVFEN